MALGDPLQWIVIGVILVVIFLWGPQKIPELAKALGRARGEFDRASKEFELASKGVGAGTPSGNQMAPRSVAAPEKTGDQILVETARALGITTEGKTRDQISQEIIAKSKSQA